MVKSDYGAVNKWASRNHFDLYRSLSVLAEFLVADDIKQGCLINVLSEFDFGKAGVYVVYPNRHYKQSKVQMFINYINENMKLDKVVS